jgi:hypothetical protein
MLLAMLLMGPEILFAETEIDFGAVEQLSVKTEEILFLNDGDEILEILGLTTDCDCTPVLLSKKIIDPGEEGRIKVTLNTDLEAGPVEGTFLVHTNDPARPEVKIKLKGTVEPAFVFDPKMLNFGVRRPGDPAKTLELKVRPVKAKGTEIRSLSCTSEHVRIERVEPFRIRVTLLDSVPSGRFKFQLVMETTHDRLPRWEIPVIGVKRAAVRAEPTLITLGSVRRGESPSAAVRVIREGAGPVQIVEVIGPDEYFVTDTAMVKEGEAEVRITLSGNAPKGMFDQEIIIKTRAETLKVRVLGLVR